MAGESIAQIVDAQLAKICAGRDYDFLTAQCNNSVKLLLRPPAQLTERPQAGGGASQLSIADELKKLVELQNSVALNEAEFQAAKAKLLKGL